MVHQSTSSPAPRSPPLARVFRCCPEAWQLPSRLPAAVGSGPRGTDSGLECQRQSRRPGRRAPPASRRGSCPASSLAPGWSLRLGPGMTWTSCSRCTAACKHAGSYRPVARQRACWSTPGTHSRPAPHVLRRAWEWSRTRLARWTPQPVRSFRPSAIWLGRACATRPANTTASSTRWSSASGAAAPSGRRWAWRYAPGSVSKQRRGHSAGGPVPPP